jgi:hypothetical protein
MIYAMQVPAGYTGAMIFAVARGETGHAHPVLVRYPDGDELLGSIVTRQGARGYGVFDHRTIRADRLTIVAGPEIYGLKVKFYGAEVSGNEVGITYSQARSFVAERAAEFVKEGWSEAAAMVKAAMEFEGPESFDWDIQVRS